MRTKSRSPKRVASVSKQRSASRPLGSSASMSMRMGSWHLQLAPAHHLRHAV